jgi:2,4-dienoyl-CoA reductase (NADPH2)
VVLYEKGTFLGGLEPLAAIIKDLETEDMLGHVKYLETQLKKLGVKVHLKTNVTADVIRAEKPDVVVLATGAAHTVFDLKGSDSSRFIPTQKLHGQLKKALKFFSPASIGRLSRLWMPVKKSVVVMGGGLHGCELAEFLVKRGRRVVIAHDGPQAEVGDGIYKDDQENLWPWFKLKQVPIWTDCTYLGIDDEGLRVQIPDKRIFTLRGKNVMTTQDWGPNDELIEDLTKLGIETHIIGSARDPGWIVDAIREGALVGYAL